MFRFDPKTYGTVCLELLGNDRLPALGPGAPHHAARVQLSALSPETLAAGTPIRDRDQASCCIAGLWLRHDFLHESHEISQEIHSPEGSYWHGIMHRREPDYANAKYWFRRVGEHPIWPTLGQAASELAAQAAEPRDEVTPTWKLSAVWDPFRFVDACQSAASGRSADELLCRRVAQLEWQILFDYCYRQAFGG